MTIKQQGGIFGRNPTFNDLTVDGEFISNGNVEIAGTASVDDQITIEKNSPASVGPKLYLHNTANDGNTGHAAEIRFNLRAAEATSRNALIGAKALGTYGSDPYIYFSTSETDSGEPTERVKVLNTGDLELVSGNLVVSSGAGIDFSATSGTGTSELFDDYEEGTWTPAVAVGSISGTGITYSGRYTKIGDTVTLYFQATTTGGVNDLVVASYVGFSGLPFVATTNVTASGYSTTEDIDRDLGGEVQINGSTFYLGPCGSGIFTSKISATLTYFTS